jgi:hypothetical protein
MLDIPTDDPTPLFPLANFDLKYRDTGGRVTADIVELTRDEAGIRIDRAWRSFQGPFRVPCPVQADAGWPSWGSLVRKYRKNEWARCAAVRTPDGHYQGAIIYRLDGASFLDPTLGAVHGEFVATAPYNRRDYAERPLYHGVGEGLMYLAMLHSYDYGFWGRVTLFSVSQAIDFYRKMKFVETQARADRMIGYELTSDTAIDLLRDRGLIR